jgi:hypothetical protein
MIKEWRKVDGVTVMNKTVINKGPDIGYYEKIKGNKIEMIKINKVKSRDKVKYSEQEYSVYSPEFRKSTKKNKKNETFAKPEKFVSFEEAGSKSKENKSETSSDKEHDKGNDDLKSKNDDKGKNKDDNKDKVKDDKGNKDKNTDKGDNKEKEKNDRSKKSDDKVKEDKGKNDKGKNDSKDKGQGKNKK